MGSVKIVSDRRELLADRKQAAEMLAQQLSDYQNREDVIVLGIPRGGVILADEMALRLHADLDVILTRKVRARGNPELATGAVAEDGKLYINQPTIEAMGMSEDYINQEKEHQLNEIQRRKERYRAVLEKRTLQDKVVILTDDGVATGSTMQASVWAAKAESPRKLILALPVAPPSTLARLAEDADETVCLCAPAEFQAISQFYARFEQVDDEQVIEVLKKYTSVKAHE